jgi:hypothetical protein
MNDDFTLPEHVTIKVEACGEANAFYDPETVSIIFCQEFVPHLRTLYADILAE